MLKNKYFNSFCEKFFDKKVRKELYVVLQKIYDNSNYSENYSSIINKYMYTEPRDMSKITEHLSKLAEEIGVNSYTLNTVFFISCSEILQARYKKAGYSEELFFNTIADIKNKTYECIFCKDVIGIFVPLWFDYIFNMELLQFGRFQFHKVPFKFDFKTKSGKLIKKGYPVYNIHIPAGGGPLIQEDCIDSFKLAYNYYKNDFDSNIMHIICGSWLLNPDHSRILPDDMNIRKFMEMFELYDTYVTSNYLEVEGCRFFGNCFGMKYEELPEDTRLQRIYKKYLLEGNKPVNGMGILLFDGEKIVSSYNLIYCEVDFSLKSRREIELQEANMSILYA